MNKFTNYIEYGKGRGLVYFLILSFVLSAILGISINSQLKKEITNEKSSDFIDRMPTITIKDGQVVAPQNSFIVVPYISGEQDAFVLDTTDTPSAEFDTINGIYLTTHTLSVRTQGSTQEVSLKDLPNVVITPETLKTMLGKLVTAIAALYALLFFGLLWVGYALIYVVIKLFFLIVGRTTCPYIRGRSVSVAWSLILILNFVLSSYSYGFSATTAFALALLLAIFIVFKTPLHSMDVEESLEALKRASNNPNSDLMRDEPIVKNVKTPAKVSAMKKTTVQKPVAKSVKKLVQKSPTKKGVVAKKTPTKK